MVFTISNNAIFYTFTIKYPSVLKFQNPVSHIVGGLSITISPFLEWHIETQSSITRSLEKQLLKAKKYQRIVVMQFQLFLRIVYKINVITFTVSFSTIVFIYLLLLLLCYFLFDF